MFYTDTKAKYLPRRINEPNSSIVVQHHEFPHFLNLWHYHEELELIYVTKSTGTCFAGDKIFSFKPGTLALMGSELPHRWLNDAQYFEEDSKLYAEAYVVHFKMGFLENDLSKIPEFQIIADLFGRSERGLIFDKGLSLKLGDKLVAMTNVTPFNRMMGFLRLLKDISEDENFQYLSTASYVEKSKQTTDRMKQVYQFVMNNFQDDIKLEEVASIVSMNPSSFCRYFKQLSRKTFFNYLHEVRIGYACKLILEQRHSITDIAYESGYNNASNFNRQFKLVTGLSPSRFLSKHKVSKPR